MLQQLIALTIIFFFIWRLSVQKRKQEINKNEYIVWLGFWILGALAIIYIRDIDRILIDLGFSGSGINFLLYITVIILFYNVFKLRLLLAKTEANITTLSRKIALNEVAIEKRKEKIQENPEA
jgi:hypothetical protein